MFNLRTLVVILFGWLSFWQTLPCTAQAPTANSYQAWVTHRGAAERPVPVALLQLLRPARTGVAHSQPGRRCGPDRALLCRPAANPTRDWCRPTAVGLSSQPCIWIATSWPASAGGGKQLVHGGGLVSHPAAGAIRGDSVPLGGTLLSVGNGYWDGWRVTLVYPDKTLGFEIGRPQPASSIGIRGGVVDEGVWHHLAASWDGRVMRIWVDGLVVRWVSLRVPTQRPPRAGSSASASPTPAGVRWPWTWMK